jgi:septal ring factor EnvC (AmiA/AmiB activator)
MKRQTMKYTVNVGIACSVFSLLAVPSPAQDVPGIEVCTRESRLDRRTGCLQSNVEFLQQVVTKNTLDAQQKLSAANREITALKEQLAAANRDVAALKDALAAMDAKIERLHNAKPPAGLQTPEAKQPGK